MSEPLMPDVFRRQHFTVAEYASGFLVDLQDVKVRTGPQASVTYEDVDRHVHARKRMCDDLGVGVDARGRVDYASASRPDRRRPAALQEGTSGAQMVRRTEAEMNAEAYADPGLHRAALAMGVKGIDPLEPTYVGMTDPGPAWNPKPVLVDNGDGTGHWATPAAKLDMPNSVFAEAERVRKPDDVRAGRLIIMVGDGDERATEGRSTPPSFLSDRGGQSRDPVPRADFSPRMVTRRRFWRRWSQRTTVRPSQEYSPADLTAWAERNDMVLVARAEFDQACADLASLMAAAADEHSDFDRFLLSLP